MIEIISHKSCVMARENNQLVHISIFYLHVYAGFLTVCTVNLACWVKNSVDEILKYFLSHFSHEDRLSQFM